MYVKLIKNGQSKKKKTFSEKKNTQLRGTWKHTENRFLIIILKIQLKNETWSQTTQKTHHQNFYKQ